MLILRRGLPEIVESVHRFLNFKRHGLSCSFRIAPPQNSQQIAMRSVFMRTMLVSSARFEQSARLGHQCIERGYDALEHRVMGRMRDREVELWRKQVDRLLQGGGSRQLFHNMFHQI